MPKGTTPRLIGPSSSRLLYLGHHTHEEMQHDSVAYPGIGIDYLRSHACLSQLPSFKLIEDVVVPLPVNLEGTYPSEDCFLWPLKHDGTSTTLFT